MRIKLFQHVTFEGAGTISEWASRRNHELSTIDIRHELQFPDFDSFDMLIVMGGPMSVNSRLLIWLQDEILFIKEALSRHKFVLGICLGAQMIAKALGAEVKKMNHPEIGWYDVELTEAGKRCDYFIGLPDKFMAFHWHGEEFELPTGYDSILQNEANQNQAFCGTNFLALQCHFEQSTDSISNMLEKTGTFLPVSNYVQEANDIIEKFDYVREIKETMFLILDNIEERIW